MPEAWIIDAVRSPRGRGKPGVGSLSNTHPQRCMAQVLNGLKDKVGFDPADIEDVIAGCGNGSGDHAHDIARMSVLDAGWPITTTGVTLHRFCGSGQQAVTFAAMGVMSGHQEAVIGGGVEFMSRYSPIHAAGFHANNEHLAQLHPQVAQGISADLIATLEGFSREDVDAYAVESQKRAQKSWDEGRFDGSIVPVVDINGDTVLNNDEHMRPQTDMQSLASLDPAFGSLGEQFGFNSVAIQRYPEVEAIEHVHHAGNSSGIVDGASAMLLGTMEMGEKLGLTPRARIRSFASVGSEPTIMLTGPSFAAEKALKRAGMEKSDIDLWELNEAFAAVVLRFMQVLDIDHDDINVCGGAIAMGHPLGATGAMILGTVLDELERTGKSTALATLCVGAGMGTATIIERL